MLFLFPWSRRAKVKTVFCALPFESWLHRQRFLSLLFLQTLFFQFWSLLAIDEKPPSLKLWELFEPMLNKYVLTLSRMLWGGLPGPKRLFIFSFKLGIGTLFGRLDLAWYTFGIFAIFSAHNQLRVCLNGGWPLLWICTLKEQSSPSSWNWLKLIHVMPSCSAAQCRKVPLDP